jgi:hypothetical protein
LLWFRAGGAGEIGKVCVDVCVWEWKCVCVCELVCVNGKLSGQLFYKMEMAFYWSSNTIKKYYWHIPLLDNICHNKIVL